MWYNHLIFHLRRYVSRLIIILINYRDNTYNLSIVDKETHNNVVVVAMNVNSLLCILNYIFLVQA